MDPERLLAIAAPVSDALSYAHRMGVLHRDIKPENILFSQGHPIVAEGGMTPLEPPARNRFIGGPTRLTYERVIEGELPEAEYPVVVDEIRRVMQNVGQVSQLDRSFSWVMTRGGSARRDLEVVVTVRSGRTRITVQEKSRSTRRDRVRAHRGRDGRRWTRHVVRHPGGVLHLPAAAFGVVIPAWIVTTFLTARTTYHFATRRRERELERLANRLATLVQELIRRGPKGPGKPARCST